MFVRVKPSGTRRYLQVVENRREGRRTVQRVIATLGRLDKLAGSGQIDTLVQSLARFADRVRLVEDQRSGRLEATQCLTIGPALVFDRLWRELGLQEIVRSLAKDRRHQFAIERAVFVTVLHRLCESGSDRQADRWLRDVQVDGAESLALHHLYRANSWLGSNREDIEERLFARSRDLFTKLTLAFFDTTSIYFEGTGGLNLGEYGHSKDHRPDRRQLVLAVVLSGDGRPIASEVLPGNEADVTAFLPVVDRLRDCFGVERVCWVADRGIISKEVIRELEARELDYIFGAKMRNAKEVREQVLAYTGRYRIVADNLKVKDIWIDDRRYVLCLNPEQAKKDRADRESIIGDLEKELPKGAKHLIANRGYRRFLNIETASVSINREKATEEERYDGKFVLRTNTDLDAGEVALQYKRLLMVEDFFRSTKSLLDTRPIFHQRDSAIIGHVFASFLALVLRHELNERLRRKKLSCEWLDLMRDLTALKQVEVLQGSARYHLRTELSGDCGKIFQAVGLAIPPTVVEADVVPRP
jgi:transposase